MLLDVSSRADQMGVTLGPPSSVDRDERGDVAVRSTGRRAVRRASVAGLPLQIMNMDVVTTARNVRAATLPQISWEPVWNIPLPIEGSPDPGDTITVIPGLVVYDNDGIPTRIFSESPYPVPIAPLPVTRHVIKEFNDPARRDRCIRSSRSRSESLRAGRLHSLAHEPDGEERAARTEHAPLRPAARGSADQGAPAGLDQARQVQRLVPGLDASARQHPLVVPRAAPVRLDARHERARRLQPEVPSGRRRRSRWCRSSGWSSRATARRSSATISTRRRRSPTSARCSSTSSSGGRGTRSCRFAASSTRSACMSSGRSR